MATESSKWPLLAVCAALAIAAFWFLTQPRPQPGPFVVSNTPTPVPTMAATPSPAAAANQPGVPAAAAENPFEPPLCGDFSCDASERCDSCAQDCGCAGDEYCNRLNGVCYELPPE